MLDKAIMLGYSGHGYVVAEATILLGFKIVGYAENNEQLNNPYNLNYLGDERNETFNWSVCSNFILGIGDNRIRARVAERVKRFGGKCLNIVHPSAAISADVKMGSGTFVARNVAINPLVKIGENVILNTSCSIDHECVIKDNVHIAPGAVLAGNVTIQNGAFIGANSVIKQGLKIGKNATVGAGCVVLVDIPDEAVVVGNPGKIKSR